MDNKGKGLMEGSPVIKLAALIIILAGVIYAQPIAWLEKKKIPKWLALIMVLLGLICLFFGFSIFIGAALVSFSSNVMQYESSLKTIINSFIQYLNEQGLHIPQDQISNLVQPEKILEYTIKALNGLSV